MVEPLTNYFVGRLTREFRRGQSSLGVMGTAVNRDLRDDNLANRMSEHRALFPRFDGAAPGCPKDDSSGLRSAP